MRGSRWTFVLIAVTPLVCSSVRAQEGCSVEVKLLLSPATAQTVISSLGFVEGNPGRVYFFDTNALDLLRQGVFVRVRQGARIDITVKVRPSKGNQGVAESRLRQHFGCEIDRTRAAAVTSFAVRRLYKGTTVPVTGVEIAELLDASQKRLLRETGASIDWASVTRIVDIKSTTWQTTDKSPPGKLALELWEWPAGKILEISAKAESGSEVSKSAELEQLVKTKSLTLSDRQDTKTSIALNTVGTHASPIR